jgi:hypothetical protein
MATRWVLDSQTKGTGATMVPLESVLTKPGTSTSVPGFNLPDRKPPAAAEPPARTHQFRIVDVMTRRVLAEGVNAREAVRVLGGVRSIVDVNISVWDPDGERWRMLSFAERRTLWAHRPPTAGEDVSHG